jgi:HAD superfamily hydrolase (TIGR01549 family)
MTIKAIFFDFDQTLVDTMPASIKCFKGWCRLTNLKPTKKLFNKFIELRVKDAVNLFHEKSGISKKELQKNFTETFTESIPEIKFYGGELLPKLKNQKIAIITYNIKDVVIPILKYFNVKYDLLITDDDILNAEKHDAMLMALKKLKLKKSEVLYVGDVITDVIESHKAGIKSVVVPTGFMKKIYIKRAHPDFFVSNINKVADLI